MQTLNYHREEVLLPSNRSFGITFCCVFFVIASISLFKNGEIQNFHYVMYAISALFLILSFAASNILSLPNKWWMAFGNILHKIMNPLIMGILFFGLVTPFAFVMRVFGSDLLDMKIENNKKSYWKEKDPAGPPPETMKNQF